MRRPPRIVTGQTVTREKSAVARELRRRMTPAERALWSELRVNRLEDLHFRRLQVIDGFVVDFYCHAAGLVVEVDGEIHAGQVDSDEERDRLLEARGVRILRFRNNEVFQHLPRVLAVIAAACRKGEET